MDKLTTDLLSNISATLSSINSTLTTINKNSVPSFFDVQWVSPGVALILGVAGIFQNNIRNIVFKPKMCPTIDLAPPDCHKIALNNTQTGAKICDTYYFRFKVRNGGNLVMEDVEVFATELHKKSISGAFEKVQDFLPINLVWAHNHYVTLPKIQPDLYKHCDFGHILRSVNVDLRPFGLEHKSKVIFLLDSEVQPNTGSHLIFPGEYKIKIVFSANNVKPTSKWVNLRLNDDWHEDQVTMFRDNVDVSM